MVRLQLNHATSSAPNSSRSRWSTPSCWLGVMQRLLYALLHCTPAQQQCKAAKQQKGTVRMKPKCTKISAPNSSRSRCSTPSCRFGVSQCLLYALLHCAPAQQHYSEHQQARAELLRKAQQQRCSTPSCRLGSHSACFMRSSTASLHSGSTSKHRQASAEVSKQARYQVHVPPYTLPDSGSPCRHALATCGEGAG
jgi:hypothetical protein